MSILPSASTIATEQPTTANASRAETQLPTATSNSDIIYIQDVNNVLQLLDQNSRKLRLLF